MPIFDLYSKRKRAIERSGQPDVYQYEIIPENVINQIVMILSDAIGDYEEGWDFIINTLAREYGDPSIKTPNPNGVLNGRQSCVNFIKTKMHIDGKLDIIELSLKLIDRVVRKIEHKYEYSIKMAPGDAISELNYRLREGGIGYQYENGVLIRMDSQFIHAEITKKALSLLCSDQFSGAEDEFLSAHKHYREGEHKEAIVDAGASFESTMKSICDARGWAYNKKARASDLLKVLKQNRLLPDYLDNSFDQLLTVLKSGLPEVRNNEGSHGQGTAPKRVPGHVAAYALHLAATNIVFLVECMKDLQPPTSN